MIIVLKPGSTDADLARVEARVREAGLDVHVSRGEVRTIIGIIGDEAKLPLSALEALPAVEKVMPVLKPYKLASREFQAEKTVVSAGKAAIGGKRIVVMAGPCSVETPEVMAAIAKALSAAGASVLRGGAFKPRSSPYAFQGLGEEGLKTLRACGDARGMAVVTEVMDVRQIPVIERYADILQVGARNMQNFNLLREVGQTRKPVLLKRGLSATVEELLLSAEYILAGGNPNVILCERGIRTFERATRNTLDVSAVAVIRQESHLPVVVDPSHAAGRRDYVPALALAAVAAGADGLIVEAHVNPAEAWSDGEQTVDIPAFTRMMEAVRKVAEAVGREA
ncbi:MAG: 3-deoxy-7-phosphoheptulonate synthase [Planctomycetota bacterium]